MIEKNEIIKTSDGNMDTFVVHPDGGSKFPLVVFLMDAPGKNRNYMIWLEELLPMDIMFYYLTCTIDLSLVLLPTSLKKVERSCFPICIL